MSINIACLDHTQSNAIMHTGPWYQASACERPVLFSVFGLAQSSRSTKRSKICCYATSCRQRAASSDRPQADEIWLSSDQQWPACPTRRPAKCTTVLQCMQFSTYVATMDKNNCRCRIDTNAHAYKFISYFPVNVSYPLASWFYGVTCARLLCDQMPFLMPSRKVTGWTSFFIYWKGRDTTSFISAAETEYLLRI